MRLFNKKYAERNANENRVYAQNADINLKENK
jgi:hypothetical protein